MFEREQSQLTATYDGLWSGLVFRISSFKLFYDIVNSGHWSYHYTSISSIHLCKCMLLLETE